MKIVDIQDFIARDARCEIGELLGPRRDRRIARPRQVAMYFARKLLHRSLPCIGLHFGRRDHTTVLHACRRIEELCKTSEKFAAKIKGLELQLTDRAIIQAKNEKSSSMKPKKPEVTGKAISSLAGRAMWAKSYEMFLRDNFYAGDDEKAWRALRRVGSI